MSESVANPVLRFFAKCGHAIFTNVLPASWKRADQILYQNSASPQSFSDLAKTCLIHFPFNFVLIVASDFLVARPLTKLLAKLKKKEITDIRKPSWYLLHTIINALVVATGIGEAIDCAIRPLRAYEPANWYGSNPGSLWGTLLIGAFHAHHLMFFETTREDVIHHLGSAGGVVLIGIFCPWGKLTSLSNMAMCGVPGGINYFLLWLRKFDLISTIRQKSINRFLNITIRFPVQLNSTYAFFVSVMNQTSPKVNYATGVFMFLANVAHYINVLYYADQVVGNYYVNAEAEISGSPKLKPSQPENGKKVPSFC